MYCYDENGILLGVVSCFPEIGEQHMWGDNTYECIGTNDKNNCTSGMVFKFIETVKYMTD
jgi:hypothetical protein